MKSISLEGWCVAFVMKDRPIPEVTSGIADEALALQMARRMKKDGWEIIGILSAEHFREILAPTLLRTEEQK